MLYITLIISVFTVISKKIKVGAANWLKVCGDVMPQKIPVSIIILASFIAFISVLFSDFIPTPFGGYEGQRFLLLGLTGLLAIAPVLSYATKPFVNANHAALVMLPTLVLCFAFLLLANSFDDQPYKWVEPGMYVFFFMAIALSGAYLSWAEASIQFAQTLVLIIAGSCLVYGLASVNVYIFAIFDGVTNLIDYIPWGFVNIRYWSQVATWCIPLMPLAVMVGPFKEIRSWRVVVQLGAGMWWWILVITVGRGSALSIAFGVTVTMLLFGRRALPWLKIFFVYLISGVVIWFLLSVFIPLFVLSDGELQVRAIHAGDSGRLVLFAEAWHMSLRNFPFGMGPQSWLTHESLTEGYKAARKLGHPHNMYLMWAAEYGWALIVALGLVVMQAAGYFWKSRALALASPESAYAGDRLFLLAAFTASVSAALFHAGLSAVFIAPGSMLVGVFVLIAFWSLIIPEKDRNSQHPRRARKSRLQMSFALLVFIVITIGWWFWAQDVLTYFLDMREDERLYHENVGEGILPRFWLHGNFPR